MSPPVEVSTGLERLKQLLATANSLLKDGQSSLPVIFGLSLAVSFLTYAIYMIYFHPLSNVPGPKLAAVSNLWLYYYEINGILTEKGLELQKKYNSDVLRVGPNRVVLHDSAQYEYIYHMGSKFLKDPSFYHHFPNVNPGHTLVTMTDKNAHSVRRKLVIHRMSKQNIGNLYGLVVEKLEKLMGSFDASVKKGTAINVYPGWRSMTLDIISTFAFGRCLNCLDEDDTLGQQTLNFMEKAAEYFYIMTRIPGLVKLINSPLNIVLGPVLQDNAKFVKWVSSCLEMYDTKDKTYLFGSMMNPPPSVAVPPPQELQAEGSDLIVAGSDTTATTLTYACVHLSRDSSLWEKVFEEILPIYRNKDVPPPLRDLESCQLLTACIKESLRLASPVPSYLWRVVPDRGWSVQTPQTSKYLPPSTVVGMSAAILHNDETLFPNATTFDPFRWLTADGKANPNLDSYLVPFSKGTRQCAGINLAWLEMYLALATTVRRFKVKGETVPGKVLYQKDFFVGSLQDDQWNILYEARLA